MKKILVIDDEPAILSVCNDLFTREGFDVLGAANGLDGIAVAISKKPDLILLDVKMPGIDGVETLGRLKSDPRTKEIKTVFFTAFTDIRAIVSNQKYISEVEKTDVITKGIELRELTERVKGYLSPIEGMVNS